MNIAIYKRFKDFEDFKTGAEFFPTGRIVPKRIMAIVKPKSLKRCNFTFNSDTWLRRVDGQNIFISCPEQLSEGRATFYLQNPNGAQFNTRPYLFLSDDKLTPKMKKRIARWETNRKKVQNIRLDGNPYTTGRGNHIVGWHDLDPIQCINDAAFQPYCDVLYPHPETMSTIKAYSKDTFINKWCARNFMSLEEFHDDYTVERCNDYSPAHGGWQAIEKVKDESSTD
ncbi:hypothetical protein NVP1244A_119 [Vibrio phage 1.244.A._10N.261.54.C3]|nr:hypothetical protein NVP1244A_119 [Vibrio phage 1.244.A._10N.261.54.C3]AUR98747.1 hypothetical protein NVP1255O_119 [Vibrio phage 1.255.O._10N.286.45.F1]